MQEEKKTNPITTADNILDALLMGTGLMIAQSPVINACNQWSVVAGRKNLNDLAAFKSIYRGDFSGKGYSVLNFRVGLAGHFTKEIPRNAYKPIGLYVYKPWLATKLSPNMADIVFAGTLSMAEMLINPADTWRVIAQAKTKLTLSIRALYAGALANGARQFGTWWGFSYTNRVLNNELKKNTFIDPHSVAGILVKSYPQGFFITSLVYGIERTKNDVQCDANGYIKAASKILREQGVGGFFRGFHPKVLSNSVAAFGAGILVELGQKSMQQNKI